MAQKGMATGRCLCGKVRIEIGLPARWAWNDHTAKSRRAHGAAYATYVGCWRSRFRIARGARSLGRFTDEAGDVRSFCIHCGTPVSYERKRSPQMVNLPRALFDSGVGREPLYHVSLEDSPEWAWRGEPLKPLKGYPGVLWTGPRKRRRSGLEALFEG
jgi:hypothetical protein